MAFPLAAVFLSYLLTVPAGSQIAVNAGALQNLTGFSYTDQIGVNASAVQRLVNYRYTTDPGELLPGVQYNDSINVSWAIDDSALRGLDGQVITVKATASASNDSVISFGSVLGVQQQATDVYLECVVANGTCSGSSNLSAEIPFTISVSEKQKIEEVISLQSEIVSSAPMAGTGAIQAAAGGLFDSFKNVFSQNDSSSGQNNTALAPAAATNSSNSSSGDFLDSLKPEGDSKNPLDFLRANPLISIAALAIVIIITGAYLVNSKD